MVVISEQASRCANHVNADHEIKKRIRPRPLHNNVHTQDCWLNLIQFKSLKENYEC